MKQLVFDSDSVIIPEQIKIKNGLNGFINGSVVTTTANVDSKVSSSRPATVQVDIKPGIEAMNDSGSQIVLNNDNYVTLHIDEDDNMAVNEMERFNQNDEISKIFKQVSSYIIMFMLSIIRRDLPMCWKNNFPYQMINLDSIFKSFKSRVLFPFAKITSIPYCYCYTYLCGLDMRAKIDNFNLYNRRCFLHFLKCNDVHEIHSKFIQRLFM